MRVDLVGPVPPPTGGIATHVTGSFAALLSERGDDVRIHAPGDGIIGATSARLGRGTGWALVAQLGLSLDRGATVHGHSVLSAHPGFRVLEAFASLTSSKAARWIDNSRRTSATAVP